jgi:hypothetical protein
LREKYLILEFFFSLEFFHLLDHDLSFSFLLFTLLQPVQLSSFNLLNDDFFAFKGFLFFPLLNFLKLFYLFEPFDFHEFVLLLFLNLETFPVPLLFFKLPLSNGSGLGIGDHLIHEFDIIEFFVRGFYCSILDACFELHLFLIEFIEGHVLFLFLLQSEHVLFLGLGEG